MRTTDDYVFFWGGPFSQWAHSPFTIGVRTYSCAEQWMMYMKAVTFGDLITADLILTEDRPSEQKALGRRVSGFDADVWSTVGYQIVVAGNIAKFQQNDDMMEALRITGERTIVEASPYDKVWGIGLREDDPLADDPANWQGRNLLGKAIMDARELLV